MSILDLRAPHH